MMHLVIRNGPPRGAERTENGLRLASALSRREGEKSCVFLLGEGAACAKGGTENARW